MSDKMLDNIMSVLPQVKNENPKLFSECEKQYDWYQRRKYFLDQNDLFLDKVIEKIKEQYQEDYSKEELFYMQKLYMLYPNTLPKQLLSLPWTLIKMILNLCALEKREYYTNLCCSNNLSEKQLQECIMNDFYEKQSILMREFDDFNEHLKECYFHKFKNVQSLIYEEI